MLNNEHVATLIGKGEFSSLKEAMEKSIGVGSQTFEQDIARLVLQGVVQRKEGLQHADSVSNLIWRLDNDAHNATTPDYKLAELTPPVSFEDIHLIQPH